ncbi:hypothetical protein RDWZM_001990 [Blomia tropicalis]|uniref:NF-kappa-B-activating protein C-terminal domain-containing protein n=1 Tax=Blomia tropicalis TaxID=40697 RepID=A0A9Q0MH41_BLOTA|nr:hypothetical protein RDWZM_001990 [Blomia tropicalis]
MREAIGKTGSRSIWGSSPLEEDYNDLSDVEYGEKHHSSKHKSKHHSKKSKKEKRKKERKHGKEKRRRSSSNSRSSCDSRKSEEPIRFKTAEEEQFIRELNERRKNAETAEENDIVGPLPKSSVDLNERDFGKALLPGEGAAMAAFVAEGKRIPRRGEIGLTCEEISSYEEVGFVMSGSRHRRMEAVRIRKENQIYSADEKRALAMFNKEERSKREVKILSQFKEMIKSKQSKH